MVVPPLLPPLLLLALLRAPGAAAPLSPLCSMAGSHDGARCACLEGWRGDRCSVLDLAPAVSADAIRAWAPAGRTSWGGTVLRDPSGKGPWHMFAAVMEGDLSLGEGWERNSTIEHLVSAAGPAGPFAPSPSGPNPVKPAEAHNPSAAYDPHTQQYCVYYIGRSPVAGQPVTPAYPTGIADIAVTCSKSLDGPWHDGPFPLVPHQIHPPRWDNWIQNPEPVFAADGSVTLILNSNQHNNTLPIGQGFSHRGIAMATAPTWRGPFTLSDDVLFKPPNADGVTPW
jgi:hypothetical protein